VNGFASSGAVPDTTNPTDHCMSKTFAHTNIRRRVVAAFVIAVAIGATTSFAGAQSIEDKKKQAEQIEADIAKASEEAADIYERLKYVEQKLAIANQTISDALARIAAAEADMRRLEELVQERAAAIYRSRSKGSAPSIFEGDTERLPSREHYAEAASDRDDALLDKLDAARDELRGRERDAREAKEIAEEQKAQLDKLKAGFEAAQANRQALLDGVNGDIAELVEEAARERAARENPPPSPGGDAFDPGLLPPASGRGGAALGYAQQQLGKQYCYAGTGPSCFDCSGLTMMSWRAAGVSLPHNSEAQYNSFPRVPMNALAGGDVVWYPGHVGLYAGNGAVIHASSSNNAVRYQSVSYYRGAVRPG
jgi:peptidoglycan DL-endopeptidase CwlO